MKNIKVSNKLLSLLTAGIMFITPAAANANGNESENANESGFELVQQIKVKQPLTLAEYQLGVQNSYVYYI